jgi:hypothetical protein
VAAHTQNHPAGIRLAYTGFILTLTMKNLCGGRREEIALWNLEFIIWDLEIV